MEGKWCTWERVCVVGLSHRACVMNRYLCDAHLGLHGFLSTAASLSPVKQGRYQQRYCQCRSSKKGKFSKVFQSQRREAVAPVDKMSTQASITQERLTFSVNSKAVLRLPLSKLDILCENTRKRFKELVRDFNRPAA
jgi:hypothetical protein